MILYDLAFIIFGIAYLPYLIITRRYRYGMANRLGFLPRDLKEACSRHRVIWIHAVSVGEIKAVSILVPLLRKTFPQHLFIFSTVTHTGNRIARTIATGEEKVFYLPFDLSVIVNKVIEIIRPELFLCLETELWPNLITALHRINTKIFLINGRISNRSYTRYKKIRCIMTNILSKFHLILMQSELDAIRMLALGGPKDRIYVTGNLKFDLTFIETPNKRRELRERLGLSEEDILIMAGSTHPGEENCIINCFSNLKRDYKNLYLFIAPRHIERLAEIEKLLKKNGFNPVRFSVTLSPSKLQTNQVVILDSIGELKTLYVAADIVIIGGSLVKKGGQNPIEPAYFSKPIIIGKYIFNFQDVVKSFLENKGIIQIENDELYSAIRFLIDNPKERKQLGLNAKETVDKNTGASKRTIDLILSSL